MLRLLHERALRQDGALGSQAGSADPRVAGDKHAQVVVLAAAHHQRLDDLPRVQPRSCEAPARKLTGP